MESIVENLAESYFNENREKAFGPKATFVKYKQIGDTRNVSIAGLSYQFAVGCIMYRKGEVMNDRPQARLLVKYFESSESEPSLLRGFVPFCQELHFYQTVLPLLDQMKPTKHLFVELCSSCTSATPTSNRNTIVFKWPSRAASFKRESANTINYPRCLLMLKTIAQFHVRSLHLEKANPDLFEGMNFACPQPGYLNTELVLPTLVRCLQQLPKDHRFWIKSFPLFREGLSRLTRMIDNFDHHLRVPFSRSSVSNHCWVMCHQNYGQESIIYEPAKRGKPAGLKLFNCQSMGFASLGVDLVIPLFVELGEFSRARHVHMLVSQYYVELQQAGSDLVGPSKECIMTEIQNSVPFALYALASRIVQANSESQSENSLFQSNLWTEELITDLFKYLITSQLI